MKQTANKNLGRVLDTASPAHFVFECENGQAVLFTQSGEQVRTFPNKQEALNHAALLARQATGRPIITRTKQEA